MSATIRSYLNYVAPSLANRRQAPSWPPDVFAIAAALLSESGAYTAVTSNWPPKRIGKTPTPSLVEWIRRIKLIAGDWQNVSVNPDASAPTQVQDWWNIIQNERKTEVRRIRENRRLCESLLQLCAVSDEASRGAGLPPANNRFEFEASSLLLRRNSPGGSTLCKELAESPLRVVPKLHTAQSGLTLNSLSHHLALCNSGDIQSRWYWTSSRPERHNLNLLIVPWPELVMPSEFREVQRTGVQMPEEYRFFTYTPTRKSRVISRRAARLFRAAEDLVGQIDGVVFPELSLTINEHKRVSSQVLKDGAFLVAGVTSPAVGSSTGQNFVRFDVPMSGEHAVFFQQNKHHRWRLDKQQIIQYGLGSSLNPERSFWEHIELKSRELMFVAMRPWLTVSVLICEDLARQQPVAELVRSIGPNLVLAVLMDGPQLATRWPSRYATVLADDPGCSVLTVSSLGMVGLCRPPNLQKKSRNIALWKDAKSGAPTEIEIPETADAVVLSLTVEHLKEWTADGRDDEGWSGYPILSGIHPIEVS
jgi:hypothetical protein